MTRKLISTRRKDVNRPPEGEPWVWETQELLTSLAWRGQSVNCRRLIDAIKIEHMAHGGAENGRLIVPYNQLVVAGIGRRLIAGSIREAEQRGLIEVERGALKGRAMRAENLYTLTWLETSIPGPTKGAEIWHAASDRWKHYRPSDKRRKR